MQYWIGISLLVYVLVMIALGHYAQKQVETEEDYLVAGRRLPLWLAWGTLIATWFGAATILGATDAARSEGMFGTILDPFAAGVALIVAGMFYAKPLWERKLLTTGDLFGRAYGPKTEILSSFVQAVGYLPWIAAQYIALGTLMQHYFPMSQTTGVLLTAAFVLFLTMSGGMWSVTLTDTLQIIIALISLVVLFATLMSQFGDGSVVEGFLLTWRVTPEEHRTLLPEGTLVAVAFWAGTWMNGILGNLPGQDLMQRVFASNSACTAQRACVLAGGMYLFFGMFPVWIGLGSRIILPDHPGEGIMFALADALFSVPMTCLFVVSLVSILVSTCTSALLSPSALLAHNLLRRIPGLRFGKLVIDRGAVLVVTLLSLPLAFAGHEILELLDVAFEIALVALFVPFTMGIFGKPKGELSGLLAVGFGTLVWVIHRWLPWLEGSFPTMVPTEFTGTFASCVGYVAGQWLIDRRSKRLGADH